MSERILMIEDDESLASMLTEYLAEAGLAVSARHDGTSGLAALAEEHFDALMN